MSLVIRGQLVRSVAVVSMTWWVGLAVHEAYLDAGFFFSNFGSLLDVSSNSLLLWLFGLAVGAVLCILTIAWRFGAISAYLENGGLRGLNMTIGTVPLQASPPPQSTVPPPFRRFGASGEAVADWLDHLAKPHPAHHAAANAILRVLYHNPKLPATHVPGGHGGKTLFEHSLLVTQAALGIARTWKYEGLKLVGLTNPHYRFDPDDPLSVLAAMAHDIGKIDCYLIEDGEVVGSRHEHDRIGANMLGRMAEIWGLPNEDREALLSIVAHYHHPMEMPMAKDGRARSDRTIAIMELVIHADKVAGKIEAGNVHPDDPDAVARDLDVANPTRQVVSYTDDGLWAAFVELVSIPGYVNGKNDNTASVLGQKCGGFAYLREGDLRDAMLVKLGMSGSPKLGDGRYQITRDLMKVLEAKGVLLQEVQGKFYSYHRALFRVAFSNSKTGAHLAEWPAVIVVNPTADLPALASILDHPSNAQIVRPLYGEGSDKKKPVDQGDIDNGRTGDDGAASTEGCSETASASGSDDSLPWLTSDVEAASPGPLDTKEVADQDKSTPVEDEIATTLAAAESKPTNRKKFTSMGIDTAKIDFAKAAGEVAQEVADEMAAAPASTPDIPETEVVQESRSIQDLVLLLIESGHVAHKERDGHFYALIGEVIAALGDHLGDEPTETIKRAAAYGDVKIVKTKEGKAYVGIKKPDGYGVAP